MASIPGTSQSVFLHTYKQRRNEFSIQFQCGVSGSQPYNCSNNPDEVNKVKMLNYCRNDWTIFLFEPSSKYKSTKFQDIVTKIETEINSRIIVDLEGQYLNCIWINFVPTLLYDDGHN